MSDLDPDQLGLDQIALRGIRARGRHGVLDAERILGQEFVVDLVVYLRTHQAAETDRLQDTVDYGELADQVVAVIAGPPVNLIETLAHRIADVALASTLVQAIDVTVHKPQAPIPVLFGDVSVRIRRWRQ
jgi:7,8-dihydroneopterin aldolase/epimerase/oxygenase